MSLQVYTDISNNNLRKSLIVPSELTTVYIRNTGITSLRLLRIVFKPTDMTFVGGLSITDRLTTIVTDLIIEPEQSVPLYLIADGVSSEIIKSNSILNISLEYL